ncbi:HAMP domain-containing histidine kinase [Peptostreptococcaceae bacterium OttesenSCG-928-C18]|nr:HAMP domain-containing histidine kinase [Peptostreptococcaceae bacterium OttesenSCG-928-C18]
MLDKLKRKFIAITMSLVSFVLLVIFFSIYTINYRSVDNSTTINIKNVSDIIIEKNKYPVSNIFEIQGYYPVVVYEKNGNYVDSNIGADPNIQEEDFTNLKSIFEYANKSKKAVGFSKEYGIKFIKLKDIDGVEYISIGFVGKELDNLKLLADMLLVAFVVAVVFIFFIARYLANWALEPVEKAWNAQKQFVADASHELKTPLTVILANLKILKKYNNLTAEQTKWIDNSNDEAIRMKDLVEEMLYLAKGDVESTKTHFSEVNFSELVEEVLLTFESIAFEKGLSLEYDNIEEEVYFIGDRNQLKRLIIILIDNACKYSEPGNEIKINLYKKDKRISFEVTSIGNVINLKNSTKIFERFIRESESRTRDGEGGYGLGLAIAKKIVENHNGKIKWKPYKDTGNTFVVELEA